MVWSIHTMEYHSALKKEMLTPTTVWMRPEDRVLREISQTQKTDAVRCH